AALRASLFAGVVSPETIRLSLMYTQGSILSSKIVSSPNGSPRAHYGADRPLRIGRTREIGRFATAKRPASSDSNKSQRFQGGVQALCGLVRHGDEGEAQHVLDHAHFGEGGLYGEGVGLHEKHG